MWSGPAAPGVQRKCTSATAPSDAPGSEGPEVFRGDARAAGHRVVSTAGKVGLARRAVIGAGVDLPTPAVLVCRAHAAPPLGWRRNAPEISTPAPMTRTTRGLYFGEGRKGRRSTRTRRGDAARVAAG